MVSKSAKNRPIWSHWLLHVAVMRLHVGVPHAVGCGEGPGALVTPVKAIWVVVGGYIIKSSLVLDVVSPLR